MNVDWSANQNRGYYLDGMVFSLWKKFFEVCFVSVAIFWHETANRLNFRLFAFFLSYAIFKSRRLPYDFNGGPLVA